MSVDKEFQYHLSKYLTTYLSGERNLSTNTISSYADTFKLLLIYFDEAKGIHPENVQMSDITRESIIDFLNWLETSRNVTAASRNIRLAAIHSFIKYVQIEEPSILYECQKILSIKNKKYQTTVIPYLTLKQIKLILSASGVECFQNLRDKTLLTLLYDTGARVDELIHLKPEDIRTSKPATVKLTGKGNKARIVPIMGNTVELIKKYLQVLKKKNTHSQYLFTNRSNHCLTRAGISYIIDKYVEIADQNGADIMIKVHPHVFRHSKAVHLLESGVELIYIRDILGHSSVKTTEIYAKVCTSNKRAALEKAYEDVIEENDDDWNDDKQLMEWLTSFSR